MKIITNILINWIMPVIVILIGGVLFYVAVGQPEHFNTIQSITLLITVVGSGCIYIVIGLCINKIKNKENKEY